MIFTKQPIHDILFLLTYLFNSIMIVPPPPSQRLWKTHQTTSRDKKIGMKIMGLRGGMGWEIRCVENQVPMQQVPREIKT